MQKLAIIGTGISGMGAAYLLKDQYDITVYEKESRIGGHTRTKKITYRDREISVDTGFIVFNYINYPELTGLFKTLDVPVEKSDMSFAFSANGGDFEWGAHGLQAIFGQRSNLVRPAFYRMIADVLLFFRKAPRITAEDTDLTLGKLLEMIGVKEKFINQFILPMGAAIWSCPADKILEFPAKSFVQFFKNHGLLSLNGQHQWYTVSNGAQNYIDRLVRSFSDKIRLSSGVRRVVREGQSIIVETNQDRQTFDKVVFATHADEILQILAAPTTQETEILGAFHYQKNDAYLHCDTSAMPRRKNCWASWNYMTDDRASNHKLSVTYWMNKLQNIDHAYPLFVTLNPINPINDKAVFDRHTFMHPIFTRESLRAQQAIPTIQGIRNTWFCGAYQRYGFHEDGLMSAVNVAKLSGALIPWH